MRSDETWDEGVPPADDAIAASAAGTADPATLKETAAAATARRAALRSENDSTMYLTI